eukprot:scaffold50388_cov33-Tisochrysis_lutea.AAC.1
MRRIEALSSSNEAHRALLNDVLHAHASVAVFARHVRHESEISHDEALTLSPQCRERLDKTALASHKSNGRTPLTGAGLALESLAQLLMDRCPAPEQLHVECKDLLLISSETRCGLRLLPEHARCAPRREEVECTEVVGAGGAGRGCGKPFRGSGGRKRKHHCREGGEHLGSKGRV